MNRIARIALGLAWALILHSQAWAGTITYYHNDLAGSPVAATNEAGLLLWREGYRPYGERLTNSPAAIDNDVWFTSRRQDETGLVYMGARYYDPVIGRFISTDPKGFDETNLHSHNRYAYANNNPYKYVDPDGRWAQLAARAVYFVSYEAATAVGAGAVGSMIGIGLHNWIHAEASDQGSGEQSKAANAKDQSGSERDSKRLFDKDQRERARDRSRDQDGDPTCEYCGVKTTGEPGQPNSSQIDHIDAWSKGGKTADENAANACRTCNASKGSKDLGTEWTPPGPWK